MNGAMESILTDIFYVVFNQKYSMILKNGQIRSKWSNKIDFFKSTYFVIICDEVIKYIGKF